MRFFRRLAAPMVILSLVTLACAMPGLGNNQLSPQAGAFPLVAITNPTAGQKLELGREVQILSTAADPEGIVRVELLVDGKVIWVDANADPQPGTPFIVAQPWTPDLPGSHVIQVRAYDKDNTGGESAAVTVEVLAASAQGQVSLPRGARPIAFLEKVRV